MDKSLKGISVNGKLSAVKAAHRVDAELFDSTQVGAIGNGVVDLNR